jgi:hypothetical protein
LYRVTTKDNDEDWFILARSARTAARLDEEYHGNYPNDAKADLVISQVPESVVSAVPCPADIFHLKDLRFEIANLEPSHREVCLNGTMFVDGRSNEQDSAVRNIQFV